MKTAKRAEVLSAGLMVAFITVSIMKGKSTETALSPGQTVLCMKDNGNLTRCMAGAYSSGPMAALTRANTRTIRNMGAVSLLVLTDALKRDSGRMESLYVQLKVIKYKAVRRILPKMIENIVNTSPNQSTLMQNKKILRILGKACR